MARGMLVFVSDIHLTDALRGPSVSRADQFERFFLRMAGAQGDEVATLVFVGDLFDLVRSPRWLDGPHRPYHDPSPELVEVVDAIADDILQREAAFFDGIRAGVEAGRLDVVYLLGNHDRLLRFAPKARRNIWKALTGRDQAKDFPLEMVFPEHGVLAYHGNVADFLNASPEGQSTIGDAIGSELILRFPTEVRRALKVGDDDDRGALDGHPLAHLLDELDDIDDVRPIYAVPAWVRQLSDERSHLATVHRAWSGVVEEFLDNHFVDGWMQEHKKAFRVDAGRRLKLLLELSCGKVMAKTHDKRLTQLYQVFQHAFDGTMVGHAAQRLTQEGGGLRFVVNGHSHFPSTVPLGHIDAKPAVYFNTGTWRTVHQIANQLGGRPTFVAYDAMAYLVFFPSSDKAGRDFEWWTGGMVLV